MDGFDAMLIEARGFFRELAAHNSRDWFDPRKDHYDAAIRRPAEILSHAMADDITRLTGTPHRAKVFRIHRDVRFSKDKSPYNAWLQLVWTPFDPNPLSPVLFFSVEPDDTVLGCGFLGLKGADLTRYRAFVDAHGTELQAAIGAAGGILSDHMAEPLARVPRPYAADHPHGDLLRRKSLLAMQLLGRDWMPGSEGMVSALIDAIRPMLPLHTLLGQAE
jgi:uncharacterized protein (TIGR02453 family)